jgi:alginate O-acetyltransferase complex protein AlgI
MVFSSITFLFFFLPAALALYSIAGRNRNLLLLLVSLFFYSWGEGIYLLVMLISILLNYVSGLLITRFRGQQRISRAALAGSLAINFSLLAFFKYANFITDNLSILLNAVHLPGITLTPVHLPIGISFFTFQATSYLIDVYRKKVEPQKNLVNLSLYISLFPQLIAGPIVRYSDIVRDLTVRKVSREDLAEGIQRFIFGLSKKVLLANPMAFTADKMFALPAAELSPGLAWLGAICYTFQIYFDFSGYSDMAIGLGRMFGFRFLENFNYPYISKSIQEFWQRWHISLSSWFRDYLYIPLGGNRCGPLRTYLNLVAVFLLCGLWHGASWNFIGWGIYHGFFLVIERTLIGKGMQLIWAPLRHLITLIIIIVGWVLFRSDTINGATTYISIMFGTDSATNWQIVLMYLNPKILFELAMAALFSFPVLSVVKETMQKLMRRNKNSLGVETVLQSSRLLIFALLSYFTVISLAASVYNPFIYFRF